MIFDVIFQAISSFFATIAFCVLFNVRKCHIFWGGMCGSVGWSIYVIFARHLYTGEVVSNFLASMAVGIFAYILSKRKFSPITIFLIPGIIPLVPGIGLYKTVYALIFKNYLFALESAITAFQVSGVIAASITIVTFIPPLFARKKT